MSSHNWQIFISTKKNTEENNSKEQTSDPAVRQKVHDLLLKVCESFKFGICFSIMVGQYTCKLYLQGYRLIWLKCVSVYPQLMKSLEVLLFPT